MGLKISIIVCTYNRAGLLCTALQSLADQIDIGCAYEVIVVDNNSTDSTREVANQFTVRYDNFRTVVEPQQGLSRARNRGCREARTDWVAYMDDDARASKNYVARMLYVIDNYDFDCFGGVYLPWFRDGRQKWFPDRYASNARIQSVTAELPEKQYFSGGNSVFKKDVLIQAGGFSAEMGMTGTKTAYGEETLLIRKLRMLGFKIGFDPDLIIEHYVGRDKQTVSWFFKSRYAHGRDSWEIFGHGVTVVRVCKALAEVFLLPLLQLPETLPGLFSKDSYVQNFLIDTFSPSAFVLAQFIEGVRLLLKRPQRSGNSLNN